MWTRATHPPEMGKIGLRPRGLAAGRPAAGRVSRFRIFPSRRAGCCSLASRRAGCGSLAYVRDSQIAYIVYVPPPRLLRLALKVTLLLTLRIPVCGLGVKQDGGGVGCVHAPPLHEGYAAK